MLAVLGLALSWWEAIPLGLLALAGVVFSLIRDRSEDDRAGPVIRQREFY